ncbi:hypothetical protein [Thioflavicoccus mobilis]|uniref:hypothetical protein n=1 Tax=Thioflavicoccus mobilis TaxID=80679 RepID=UPI000687FB60|nr:hypothetical protein [Thioflavicoccus mobilis]
MQRATELDLALDVDHLALAQAHPDGDAAGMTEGEVAKGHDGQAIDLADLFAVGVDQDGAAGRLLAQLAGDAVGALVVVDEPGAVLDDACHRCGLE